MDCKILTSAFVISPILVLNYSSAHNLSQAYINKNIEAQISYISHPLDPIKFFTNVILHSLERFCCFFIYADVSFIIRQANYYKGTLGAFCGTSYACFKKMYLLIAYFHPQLAKNLSDMIRILKMNWRCCTRISCSGETLLKTNELVFKPKVVLKKTVDGIYLALRLEKYEFIGRSTYTARKLHLVEFICMNLGCSSMVYISWTHFPSIQVCFFSYLAYCFFGGCISYNPMHQPIGGFIYCSKNPLILCCIRKVYRRFMHGELISFGCNFHKNAFKISNANQQLKFPYVNRPSETENPLVMRWSKQSLRYVLNTVFCFAITAFNMKPVLLLSRFSSCVVSQTLPDLGGLQPSDGCSSCLKAPITFWVINKHMSHTFPRFHTILNYIFVFKVGSGWLKMMFGGQAGEGAWRGKLILRGARQCAEQQLGKWTTKTKRRGGSGCGGSSPGLCLYCRALRSSAHSIRAHTSVPPFFSGPCKWNNYGSLRQCRQWDGLLQLDATSKHLQPMSCVTVSRPELATIVKIHLPVPSGTQLLTLQSTHTNSPLLPAFASWHFFPLLFTPLLWFVFFFFHCCLHTFFEARLGHSLLFLIPTSQILYLCSFCHLALRFLDASVIFFTGSNSGIILIIYSSSVSPSLISFHALRTS
ncbi:putative signal peptide protein [Puccinia sorghi]|uniref:Putative signal peptide protein n=1 Tax=Puccinia sorghi TaxID=27349 RepID=A0A0L6UJ83_9BASI|nr:putative signal peptide protein [Puccinia sorghi]